MNKNWELSNEGAAEGGKGENAKRMNSPIGATGRDVCSPREGPEHGHVAYEPARIFVEQCRYEWHNLGVDATRILAYLEWIADNHAFHGVPGVATGVYLFDRVKDGTAMMRYLAGHGLVRPVTDRPVGDPTPARRPGSLYPEPLETTPHHGNNALTPGRPRKILEAVMHGEVAIECRLRVASENETRSAFVDGFSYNIKFLTPTGGEERARIDTAP